MNNEKRQHWYIAAIILACMFLLTLVSTYQVIWDKADTLDHECMQESKPGAVKGFQGGDAASIVELAQKAKPASVSEPDRLEYWKQHFPFKPLYHSNLRHDPGLYDPTDPSTWDMPDEAEARLKHNLQHAAVQNHGFLAAFHENPLRFSREFEQLYHLLEPYDRHDNAINVAEIFTLLCYYHKAARHDPHDLTTKSMPFYNEATGEHGIHQVPVDGKTTWRDEMQSYREGIAFVLFQQSQWPGKKQMPAQKAWDIADLLIATIPSENLVQIPHMSTFAFSSGHESDLKPGQPFLIPKEGFIEDYYEHYLKKYEMPIHINRENNPDVLVRGEDGQFYDKATGKPFMPGFKPIEIRPGETFPR